MKPAHSGGRAFLPKARRRLSFSACTGSSKVSFYESNKHANTRKSEAKSKLDTRALIKKKKKKNRPLVVT